MLQPIVRIAASCSSVSTPSATGRTAPSPERAWNTPPGSRDRGLSEVCTAEVPIPYAKHLEQAALPQPETIVAAVRGLFGDAGVAER